MVVIDFPHNSSRTCAKHDCVKILWRIILCGCCCCCCCCQCVYPLVRVHRCLFTYKYQWYWTMWCVAHSTILYAVMTIHEWGQNVSFIIHIQHTRTHNNNTTVRRVRTCLFIVYSGLDYCSCCYFVCKYCVFINYQCCPLCASLAGAHYPPTLAFNWTPRIFNLCVGGGLNFYLQKLWTKWFVSKVNPEIRVSNGAYWWWTNWPWEWFRHAVKCMTSVLRALHVSDTYS